MNAIGALLVLISFYFHFNLSAFIIEFFGWLSAFMAYVMSAE
ncbi:CBU_0592 family membrane protein [Cognaticolwellia beringensis]